MTLVVGLLGRAGSGKSTAAKYLEQRYGAKRYAFAAPVKELAKRLWDFSDEQLYGMQEQKEAVDPRWGISPRTAMIRLGDEARNVVDPFIWVNGCFNRILSDRPKIAVIEDVRYSNEVAAIRSHISLKGKVVKLEYADRKSNADLDAPSERSVDEVKVVDHVLRHSESPDALDLKSRLDTIVGPWLEEMSDVDHR